MLLPLKNKSNSLPALCVAAFAAIATPYSTALAAPDTDYSREVADNTMYLQEKTEKLRTKLISCLDDPECRPETATKIEELVAASETKLNEEIRQQELAACRNRLQTSDPFDAKSAVLSVNMGRHLTLNGFVDRVNIESILVELRQMLAEDPKSPIFFEIGESRGGDVSLGNQLMYHLSPLNVHTYNTGFESSSMAAFMLMETAAAASEKTYVAPMAQLNFHHASTLSRYNQTEPLSGENLNDQSDNLLFAPVRKVTGLSQARIDELIDEKGENGFWKISGKYMIKQSWVRPLKGVRFEPGCEDVQPIIEQTAALATRKAEGESQ